MLTARCASGPGLVEASKIGRPVLGTIGDVYAAGHDQDGPKDGARPWAIRSHFSNHAILAFDPSVAEATKLCGSRIEPTQKTKFGENARELQASTASCFTRKLSSFAYCSQMTIVLGLRSSTTSAETNSRCAFHFLASQTNVASVKNATCVGSFL